jgi:hypothetical protein
MQEGNEHVEEAILIKLNLPIENNSQTCISQTSRYGEQTLLIYSSLTSQQYLCGYSQPSAMYLQGVSNFVVVVTSHLIILHNLGATARSTYNTLLTFVDIPILSIPTGCIKLFDNISHLISSSHIIAVQYQAHKVLTFVDISVLKIPSGCIKLGDNIFHLNATSVHDNSGKECSSTSHLILQRNLSAISTHNTLTTSVDITISNMHQTL